MKVKELKQLLSEMPEDNDIIFIGKPFQDSDKEIIDNPERCLTELHFSQEPAFEAINDRYNISAIMLY